MMIYSDLGNYLVNFIMGTTLSFPDYVITEPDPEPEIKDVTPQKMIEDKG